MRVLLRDSYPSSMPYGFEAVLLRSDGVVVDRLWERWDLAELERRARKMWPDVPVETEVENE